MKISAIVIGVGLLALVIFTTGCVQEQSDTGMTVTTITDMAGRNVTIPAEVNSVVTLYPPALPR